MSLINQLDLLMKDITVQGYKKEARKRDDNDDAEGDYVPKPSKSCSLKL